MGIALKLFVISKHRPPVVLIPQEQLSQAAAQLRGDFVYRDVLPRAGGTFDFEIVAVVVMEFLQRFDYQEIDRKPDRSPPVRIAAEQT